VPKGASPAGSVQSYAEGFAIYGALTVGTAILLWLLLPRLRRFTGTTAEGTNTGETTDGGTPDG
jgi:hypothetical protein